MSLVFVRMALLILPKTDQDYRLGGNRFASPNRIESFTCFCLDTDAAGSDAQDSGQAIADLRNEWRQLWPLSQDDGIDIYQLVTTLPDQRHHIGQ